MTNLDRRPTQEEINTWLSSTYPDMPATRATAFAVFFEGLAWKHLRPLSKDRGQQPKAQSVAQEMDDPGAVAEGLVTARHAVVDLRS